MKKKPFSLYEWAFYVLKTEEKKGPFCDGIDMAEIIYELAQSIIYDQKEQLKLLIKQRKLLKDKSRNEG